MPHGTKHPAVYIMMNRPNGTLYTGVTSNLAQRIWQHREAAIPGFTTRYGLDRLLRKSRRPRRWRFSTLGRSRARGDAGCIASDGRRPQRRKAPRPKGMRRASRPSGLFQQPVEHLVWFESYATTEHAILREKQLEGGSRAKKLALITALNPDWRDLYEDIR